MLFAASCTIWWTSVHSSSGSLFTRSHPLNLLVLQVLCLLDLIPWIFVTSTVCSARKDSWESLGLQRDPTSPFWRRSAMGFLWKEWFWSSSTLATSCEELTHWKRLWCWEGLGAGGEGDDRGWDGWMASLTRWTWVWVNSGRWWWTGRPGVLWFMGSQRVGHDWVTELNWTEHLFYGGIQ